MKVKIVYLLGFVLGIASLNAQTKEDVVKKIAQESCKCTVKTENLENTSAFTYKELVPCIVNSVNENYNLIETVYQITDKSTFINLVLKDIILEMINNCPERFSELVKTDQNNQKIEGKITKVNNSEISITDNSGVTHNLLVWIKFPGADLMTENKLKKGDPVLFRYKEIELYDSKIKNFKNQKVIILLEKK